MLSLFLPLAPGLLPEGRGRAAVAGGSEQQIQMDSLPSLTQHQKNRSLCITLKEKNKTERTPNAQ